MISETDSEIGEVLGKCFNSDQKQNTAELELEQITIRDSKSMNQTE